MNRGDVVLCKMYGKEYKALVWGENVSNDAHRGTNGEPSLHLLMVTEPLKPLPLGQQPEPTIVYDVLHESFAGVKTAEWSEASVIKQPSAADLDAMSLAAVDAAVDAAQAEHDAPELPTAESEPPTDSETPKE